MLCHRYRIPSTTRDTYRTVDERRQSRSLSSVHTATMCIHHRCVHIRIIACTAHGASTQSSLNIDKPGTNVINDASDALVSVYIRLVYWRAIFSRVRVVVAAHCRTTDVDFDSSSRLETTTASRVQTATGSHTALHVLTSIIIISPTRLVVLQIFL